MFSDKDKKNADFLLKIMASDKILVDKLTGLDCLIFGACFSWLKSIVDEKVEDNKKVRK